MLINFEFVILPDTRDLVAPQLKQTIQLIGKDNGRLEVIIFPRLKKRWFLVKQCMDLRDSEDSNRRRFEWDAHRTQAGIPWANSQFHHTKKKCSYSQIDYDLTRWNKE